MIQRPVPLRRVSSPDTAALGGSLALTGRQAGACATGTFQVVCALVFLGRGSVADGASSDVKPTKSENKLSIWDARSPSFLRSQER